MSVDEAALAARVLHAYERGRLCWALRRSMAAVALTALAFFGCPAPGRSALCAALLGLALASCLWRGGSWARGARLGFLAGLAPCLLPAAARAAHACCERLCPTVPTVCLAGGIAAGLLLGWLGLQVQGDRRFWLAAASTTLLAGAIGCLPAGIVGVGGMTLGVLAGATAPVVFVRVV